MLYGTTTHFLGVLRPQARSPTSRRCASFTELSDDSRRVAEAELGEVVGNTIPPRDTVVPDATQAAHDTVVPPDPAEKAPATGGGASTGDASMEGQQAIEDHDQAGDDDDSTFDDSSGDDPNGDDPG